MEGNVFGHWVDRQPGADRLSLEFVWTMEDMAKDDF